MRRRKDLFRFTWKSNSDKKGNKEKGEEKQELRGGGSHLPVVGTINILTLWGREGVNHPEVEGVWL